MKPISTLKSANTITSILPVVPGLESNRQVIDSNLDKIKSASEVRSTLKIAETTVLDSTPSLGINYGMQEKRKSNFVAWQKVKKVKFYHDTTTDPSAHVQLNVPLGTQWQNNSCAYYDAIITVLFNIWFDSGGSQSSIEHTQCDMFDDLIQCFRSHESCQVVSGSPTYSLEQVQEYFRRFLARASQEFTFG